MKFTFDSEHHTFRSATRALLRDKVDLLHVVGANPAAAAPEYPADLRKTAVELGWPALAVPEEYGGLGADSVTQAVLLEELGRALAPCPYLGHYLGTQAVLQAATEQQKRDLLPAVAAGEVRFGLAWNEGTRPVPPDRVETVVCDGRASGTKTFVVDADSATHLVLLAKDDQGHPGLFIVEASDAGVAASAVPCRDITRRISEVRLQGAPAEPMMTGLAAAQAWLAVVDRALLAVSADSVGGAAAVLQAASEYARQRIQFGRPIASFQAIKHKAADMFVKIEAGKALAYYGAWALSTGDRPRERLAAAMAISYCTDAYRYCTAEAIQIHGAVGLTWELPLHLYYKRARADAMLLGTAAHHRSRVPGLVQQHGHPRYAAPAPA